MTLEIFLANYEGNVCVSIRNSSGKSYCEEGWYEYYTIPEWIEDEEELQKFIAENRFCIFLEPWWHKVKDMEIKNWAIIGGGVYPVELTITVD